MIWNISDFSELMVAAGKYSQPPIYKEFQFRENDEKKLLHKRRGNIHWGTKDF